MISGTTFTSTRSFVQRWRWHRPRVATATVTATTFLQNIANEGEVRRRHRHRRRRSTDFLTVVDSAFTETEAHPGVGRRQRRGDLDESPGGEARHRRAPTFDGQRGRRRAKAAPSSVERPGGRHHHGTRPSPSNDGRATRVGAHLHGGGRARGLVRRWTHVTIAGNAAPEGANIFIEGPGDVLTTFGTVHLRGAGPGAGDNCALLERTARSSRQGWNWSDRRQLRADRTPPTSEDGGDPLLEAAGGLRRPDRDRCPPAPAPAAGRRRPPRPTASSTSTSLRTWGPARGRRPRRHPRPANFGRRRAAGRGAPGSPVRAKAPSPPPPPFAG